MRILGLVPARGGSRGFPGKNLALLDGKPLIAHAIESALRAPSITDLVVSTDSPEIAAVAAAFGALVPFLRPSELAGDEVPDGPVLRHALEKMLTGAGLSYDAIALLRPTTPLRTPEDIEGAIAAHRTCGLPVRSVSVVSQHPYWMKTIGSDGLLRPLIPGNDETTHPRRQLLPPVYYLNGVIDVVKADIGSLASNSMFGIPVFPFVIPQERAVDIDTPDDLASAQAYLDAKHKSNSTAI